MAPFGALLPQKGAKRRDPKNRAIRKRGVFADPWKSWKSQDPGIFGNLKNHGNSRIPESSETSRFRESDRPGNAEVPRSRICEFSGLPGIRKFPGKRNAKRQGCGAPGAPRDADPLPALPWPARRRPSGEGYRGQLVVVLGIPAPPPRAEVGQDRACSQGAGGWPRHDTGPARTANAFDRHSTGMSGQPTGMQQAPESGGRARA